VSDALPQPLVVYAIERIVGDRSPAFLRVSREGIVLEWGGVWRAFGVEDLEIGAPAATQVPFLAGVSFQSREVTILPCLALVGGLPADVHVVPDDAGCWILLLDASAAMRYQEIGQQAANELALLREAYEKLRARVPPAWNDPDLG
jgi:hypothetical protein